MKNLSKIMNSKIFITMIRTIGMIYIIAIIINTLFFYGQYMYETFLGSGLCGIIAAAMIWYKVPSKKWKLLDRIYNKINRIFDRIN